MLLPLSVMEIPQKTEVSGRLPEIPKAENAVSETFKICDTKTDTVTEIKTEDYIFGVVAAEMPALYEQEALKAQAVAAYTFACFRKAENKDKSYDITTDHTLDQSFITEEEARKKWGDNADEYVNKIKSAVSSVKDYMITFEGRPILAVYHAISSGKTEKCADVWDKDYEYLRAVSSLYDKLSPDYISEKEVSLEELKAAFSEECSFEGSAGDFFSDIKRTESGAVKTLKLSGVELNGAKIRSAFSLRSSNFQVKFKDDKFIFTVYGYGHGVGMSQYGADHMAKQGSDFKAILTHYYKGSKVIKV